MLVIFIGCLAFLLGFAVLMLPLLVTELSRPRDALWGAVGLLLGLILVISNDRFTGLPMLVVGLGALVIIRLGWEVSKNRWQQLSNEEQARLGSFERWITGFKQFGATLFQLVGMLGGLIKFVVRKPNKKNITKKWVRSEKNKVSEPADQAITNSNEKLQSAPKVLQQEPLKTLEGHSLQKDS